MDAELVFPLGSENELTPMGKTVSAEYIDYDSSFKRYVLISIYNGGETIWRGLLSEKIFQQLSPEDFDWLTNGQNLVSKLGYMASRNERIFWPESEQCGFVSFPFSLKERK